MCAFGKIHRFRGLIEEVEEMRAALERIEQSPHGYASDPARLQKECEEPL